MRSPSLVALAAEMFAIADAGGGGAGFRRDVAELRARLGIGDETDAELVALINARMRDDPVLRAALTAFVFDALQDHSLVALLHGSRSTADMPLAERLAGAARAGVVPAAPATEGLVDCTVFAPSAAVAGEPVLV